MSKSSENLILLIFALLFLISYFVMTLFFTGTSLYELLLFHATLGFLIIYFLLIRTKNLSFNQKLNLILTLVIAFLALVQVWVALYEKIPRVFSPGLYCQKYLYLNQEGYGKFSVSFGNYGELPAWLKIEFQNTTNSISSMDSVGYTLVLVPISYQNNQQTSIIFNFKVNTSSQIVGFKVRNLIFGDDLIDKSAAGLKKIFNIASELPCKYSKMNNTLYSLV